MKVLFRYSVLFITIIASQNISNAQELNFGCETGLASFNMASLKSINSKQVATLPFETKVLENFPIYWYAKPTIAFINKANFGIGLALTYTSTGSRVSREDYSGAYKFDIKISSWSEGFFIDYNTPISKFSLFFRGEIGYQKSNLSLKEYFRLGTEKNENNFGYISHNIYFEPKIILYYSFQYIKLGVNFGYLLNPYKGDLYVESHDTNYLRDADYRPAVAEWSGLRFGISMFVNILESKK